MAPFLKTHGLRLVVGLIAVYLIFFLSLGTRTLAQHIWRIGATPEARELYSELAGTIGSATSSVARRIRGGGEPSSAF